MSNNINSIKNLNYRCHLEQRLRSNVLIFACFILTLIINVAEVFFLVDNLVFLIAILLPIPVLLFCILLPKKLGTYIPLVRALIINSVLYTIILLCIGDYSSLWRIILSGLCLFIFAEIWGNGFSYIYEDILKDRKKLSGIDNQTKANADTGVYKPNKVVVIENKYRSLIFLYFLFSLCLFIGLIMNMLIEYFNMSESWIFYIVILTFVIDLFIKFYQWIKPKKNLSGAE